MTKFDGTKPESLAEATISAFRQLLLDWYDREKRDLPWRASTHWYPVLLSEMMLQQTQVKTVLPYFDAWLRRFPDPGDLARAPEAEVLKAWEGLGYYSRARNLHRCVQELVARPRENFPRTAEAWRALPGIGPYTAAAIASIAFDDPVPVVDGNVVRVLLRLTADGRSFAPAKAVEAVRPLAARLIAVERPGDFNQAVMELGATVCVKHRPACLLCPVSTLCAGREQGIAADLPRLEKVAIRKRSVERALLIRGEQLLLFRYPAGATRLAGVAELPELGLLTEAFKKCELLATRQRGISNERITEKIFRVEVEAEAEPLLAPGCFWVTRAELGAEALSGPHRRWIQELW